MVLMERVMAREAARCRRIAAGMTNPEDIKLLDEYATELERKAKAGEQPGHSFARPQVDRPSGT